MADFVEYITKDGDRWDLIAFVQFGDANKIALLVDANPHIPTDAVLPPGLRMLVPIQEPESDAVDVSLLPPWKR